MSKQAIVNVDGTTYIIDAFKGARGFRYLPKITKLILPFLFGADATISEEDLKEQAKQGLSEEKTVEILMDLLSGDNADELIDLVTDLVQGVTKNGSVIDFDEEFSQNYSVLLKLVFEVIKLNYLNSFQKLVSNGK